MSVSYKIPKPMFNISGHSHGPESSIFGKNDIKRELAALMDDRERRTSRTTMLTKFSGVVDGDKISP